MKVAITGAAGFLGTALTSHLTDAGHDVCATDVDDGDVLDEAAVERLVDGVDRVVHLARARRQPDETPAVGDARVLDTALKGTWNVLLAARAAGVAQVVQVSDVAIHSGYADDTLISEDMVSLPDTSAEQQAEHLAEQVAHEFGRDRPGSVLTLRLGRLVDETTLPANTAFDPDWLDVSDAVAAIGRGLELESYDHPQHWGLYNLVADTPRARFTLRIKAGRFEYSPRVDFRAWWPEQGGDA